MKEEVSKYSFYKSFYETIKKISNEDAGKLIKAINEYVFEDKEPEIGGIVEIIFPTIKAILKKDKTDRLNGHNGGRPKSKRGVSENQKGGLEKKENPALEKSKTNDNDNDNDKCKMINDNDNDNDKEKMIKKENQNLSLSNFKFAKIETLEKFKEWIVWRRENPDPEFTEEWMKKNKITKDLFMQKVYEVKEYFSKEGNFTKDYRTALKNFIFRDIDRGDV